MSYSCTHPTSNKSACHEIHRYEWRLYLTSTGFDAILGFDLDKNWFSWGLNLTMTADGTRAAPFNPERQHRPSASNELHLNSVYCTNKGMFISGLRTEGILRFSGKRIEKVITLPHGVHYARPFRDGVLYNDTMADLVRFQSPGYSTGVQSPALSAELVDPHQPRRLAYRQAGLDTLTARRSVSRMTTLRITSPKAAAFQREGGFPIASERSTSGDAPTREPC